MVGDGLDDLAQHVLGAERHQALPLQEAAGPYMRFQPSTMSSGYQNLSIVIRWSRRRRGALRYQNSLKAAIEPVEQGVGGTGGAGTVGGGR